MSAAHCRTPAACSVCLGATARRVTLASDGPRVDGAVVDDPLRARALERSRRGARATAMRTSVHQRGAR